MDGMAEFKSRTGRLECTPAEAFYYVTDLRNLKQFIRGMTVNDLSIDSNSCSFNLSPVGQVKMNIKSKEPVTKVLYDGSLMKSNDFSLLLELNNDNAGKAEVVVTVRADLNPVLRMMAEKPVSRFLDGLIGEMEKFRNWKNINE
jgi:carbon monoxide dehydrogenase subunit G